jgi:hypothetical protein
MTFYKRKMTSIYLQKVISSKNRKVRVLEVKDENISIRIRIHGQRHGSTGSGSIPKCHEFTTLVGNYELIANSLARGEKRVSAHLRAEDYSESVED